MSIFDITKSNVDVRYDKIVEKSANNFKGEKARCLSAFNDLWGSEENPIAMEEAQAVLDKFGSETVQLFLTHSQWQTFIKSVDESYELLVPPYDYAINEDGTVTLSEKGEADQTD